MDRVANLALRKKVKGQPRITIRSNLLDLEFPMLYIKS